MRQGVTYIHVKDSVVAATDHIIQDYKPWM